MSKDFAFLFYDGDAARDVSHMSRLERGCYFDLIQAQRKFHGITTEQARKILGRDFEQCWPQLEVILEQGEDGKYYIDWLRKSILNRAEYSDKQRDRIQKYWDDKKSKGEKTSIPRNNHGTTVDIPYISESESESIIIDSDKDKKGVQGEEKGKSGVDLPNCTDLVPNLSLKSQFERFREAYPGGKRGSSTEFDGLVHKHKDWKQIIPILYDRLQYQIEARHQLESQGCFVPSWKLLQTYLNQRSWEEEVPHPAASPTKRNGKPISAVERARQQVDRFNLKS